MLAEVTTDFTGLAMLVVVINDDGVFGAMDFEPGVLDTGVFETGVLITGVLGAGVFGAGVFGAGVFGAEFFDGTTGLVYCKAPVSFRHCNISSLFFWRTIADTSSDFF